MFDVDGTLTPARLQGSPEMLQSLKKLREYTATAFVGCSNFPKIEWQLEIIGEKSKSEAQLSSALPKCLHDPVPLFHYIFKAELTFGCSRR